MKFTTWQLVVILAILVAGIIVANVFAPGAVATVTAMATTLFAALFVTHDSGPKDPPPGGGPPTLTLVSGALLLAVAACGALTPAEEAHVAQDSIELGTCAASAHLCKADHPDANYSACWAEFDACMTAHGFADGGK